MARIHLLVSILIALIRRLSESAATRHETVCLARYYWRIDAAQGSSGCDHRVVFSGLAHFVAPSATPGTTTRLATTILRAGAASR